MVTEVSNRKQSRDRDRVVAPSRFEDTESYLAALLFGSNSAAAQIGTRFTEVNPDA